MEKITLDNLETILTSSEYSKHYIENYQYPIIDKPEEVYKIKLDRLNRINDVMGKMRVLKKQLSSNV